MNKKDYTIKLHDAQLPWIAERMKRTGNISRIFKGKLPAPSGQPVDFIPRYIEFFVSEQLTAKSKDEPFAVINYFLKTLQSDLPRVAKRLDELRKKTGLSTQEIKAAARNASAPWYIVELSKGGLGTNGMATGRAWTMVPCRFYISHGVLWDKNAMTGNKIALVTARLPGKPFDTQDDVVHELLHASIASIPIYVQSWQIQLNTDAQHLEVRSVEKLGEHHLGWMTYAIPELVVAYLGNEKRTNKTGLPVLETKDMLTNFFKLSSMVMPRFGFAEAKRLFDSEGFTPATHRALVSSCIRALGIYDKILSSPTPPLEYFKKLSRSQNKK
ncbi:hypothetical protein A3A38_04250 [Candidatus Kaiserbacteria bacterium RIFCSPLOWO2_01_FULL_53_17]|uniref:Uncharacterized protein n=1 Tax=Candidatus Kaiserbacteria bacterium RIFCSPLOWO2_01_FULL_53_17 TaxID=1798511 RepID=A0A1F6EHK1_9BACT|nr:MAG: hypothetical protein A3A38_04250 [Candidatus Kaiserbacteria bacterium RIFCSPLOWO2_01_FULL_53_17]